MICSSVPYSSDMARRKVVAGNLPDWSILMSSTSFFVTESSTQLPRCGIVQQECSFFSLVWSSTEKSTPGERCSWLTMTRSLPLMMNSPPPTMIGISPRYTHSSTGSGFSSRTSTLKGMP
jgi:hypothetical protein